MLTSAPFEIGVSILLTVALYGLAVLIILSGGRYLCHQARVLRRKMLLKTRAGEAFRRDLAEVFSCLAVRRNLRVPEGSHVLLGPAGCVVAQVGRSQADVLNDDFFFPMQVARRKICGAHFAKRLHPLLEDGDVHFKVPVAPSRHATLALEIHHAKVLQEVAAKAR